MKLAKKLCAVLLILCFCTSGLIGCSSELNFTHKDKAITLYEQANQGAAQTSSYTLEMMTAITMKIDGTEYTISDMGTAITAGIGTDSFSYYAESTTVTNTFRTFAGRTTTSTITELASEGYQNGKMFRTYNSEGKVRKLTSFITQKDYLAHIAQMGNEFDFDLAAGDCATRTCVEQEDGTWVATYTDFTARALFEFSKGMGLATLTDAAEEGVLVDMLVTFKATADLLPQSVEFEFLFEDQDADGVEDTMPHVRVAGTYKDFNTTAPAAAIDFSDYTPVCDLRQLDIVERELAQRTSAEMGEFTYTTSTTIEDSVIGKNSGSATYEVAYLTFAGNAFAYTVTATAVTGNNIPGEITYRNGVRTEKARGAVAGTEYQSNDAAERARIMGMLNPGGFVANNIVGITAVDAENGVYLFTYAEDALMEQELEEGKDMSGTLKTTITNGKLVKCEYTQKLIVMVKYTTGYGSTLSVPRTTTKTADCTYK